MSLTSGGNATISTLSFIHNYTDVDGSLRTEVSRGVNLPETMEVKRQVVLNKALNCNVTETAVIFKAYYTCSDSTIRPVTATLKLQVPVDSGIDSTEALAPIVRVNGLIDPTSPNLDAATDIFISGIK